MGVAERRIRNLAVGLVVRDGHALLEEYPGDGWRGGFLRALGGGVEFGERRVDAVVREFREELGVDVRVVASLGSRDNIFTWQGEPAHEVVHVYQVDAPDLATWPLDERRPIADQVTDAGWYPLDSLAGRDVYPDGIVEQLRALGES